MANQAMELPASAAARKEAVTPIEEGKKVPSEFLVAQYLNKGNISLKRDYWSAGVLVSDGSI